MATQLIPHSFLFPWVSLPWTTGKFKNFSQNPCEERPQHPFAPVNPKQPGDALLWARICLKTVSQTVVMHAFHSLRSETKDMVNMVNPILGDPGADSGGEAKSKRAEKYSTKTSKERPEEPLGTMSFQTSSKRSPPFWLLIGQKNTKVFWHQSEARTAATVWNWSGKTLSPGALLAVLYFSSCYIFPPVYTFPRPHYPPLGLRMGQPKLVVWLHPEFTIAVIFFMQIITNKCRG